MSRHRSLWTITIVHIVAFFLGQAAIFTLTLGLPDAALSVAGPFANKAALDEIRHQFELESSIPIRFIGTWQRLLTGDLRSMYSDQSVVAILGEKLRESAQLLALAIVLTVGIAALILWALGRSTRIRRVLDLAIGVAATVPVLVTATLLMVVSSRMRAPPLLPAALALSLFPAILISTNLFERWREIRAAPYNLLASHYGVADTRLMWTMTLDSAGAATVLINAIMYFALTGIIIVEPIFGVPGVGRWVLTSVIRLDLPAVFAFGVGACGFVVLLSWVREMLVQRNAKTFKIGGAP